MSEQRFTITVVPVPGWGVPPIIRLRKFLRSPCDPRGLRCVECQENTPPVPASRPAADTRGREK